MEVQRDSTTESKNNKTYFDLIFRIIYSILEPMIKKVNTFKDVPPLKIRFIGHTIVNLQGYQKLILVKLYPNQILDLVNQFLLSL